MKKITFLMMAVMLSIVASMADDFDNGDFRFRTGGLNGGVLVMGPSAAFAGGAFNIPATATYNSVTYNVTELRNYFISKFADDKRPTSITVPEGVVNIGVGSGGSFDASATIKAGALTSIALPSTITTATFTNFTFNSLPALTDLTIKDLTPPTVSGENTFYDVPGPLTIHIPVGTLATYQTAGWGAILHASLVEDVTTSVNEVSALDVKAMALSANCFAIAGIKGAATVNVMNLAGKRVAQFSNVIENQILSSSLLNKGIYIVSVSGGVNSSNIKLVLN